MEHNPNNPFQNLTLEKMLEFLFAQHGWEGLCREVSINCFCVEPSMKSSLTFLRKTPWARAKVEELYLKTRRIREKEMNA